jgi:hypothetical protein
MDRTQIIKRAFGLTQVVAGFVARAREFFYSVVLSDRLCPRCSGPVTMEIEGGCRCRSCRAVFDPTVVYQVCQSCGGCPRLRVRRYACASCGAEVVSRFLFDGRVFDNEYFRQRMVESRRRRKGLRERVRRMLAESRSGNVDLPPADLAAVPDLLSALNGLAGSRSVVADFAPRSGFDLKRYQRHIEAHLQPIPLRLEGIPPLDEDGRIDRICRFIAVVILAHAGVIDIWQAGSEIMVIEHEANTEGQGIPGESEEPDGVEGLVGRAEA